MAVTTRVDVEMFTNPGGKLVVPRDPRFVEILKRLYKTRKQGDKPGTFTAVLVPEDPDLVAVMAAGPGKAGYLGKEDAAAWRDTLVAFKGRSGCHAGCEGKIVASHVDDPSLHVELKIVREDVESWEPDEDDAK
jgi:hypothetical protein